jgi:hypothetical protein
MEVNNSRNNVQLPFGLRNGELVHITEVVSGLACRCYCAACGAMLVAKKGDKNTHHFAHHIDQACADGFETVLHYAAKQVLQESLEIVLPKLVIHDQVTGTVDGQKYFKSGSAEVCEVVAIKLERVELEKRLNNIIPDVIAYVNGEPLLIEIAVTHFVDEDKEQKINTLNYPTIEIDLSDINRDLDYEVVRKLVVTSIENKKWLFNSNEVAVRRQLKQRLRQELELELEAIRLKNIESNRLAAEHRKRVLAKEEKDRRLISGHIRQAKHYLNDLNVIQTKYTSELVSNTLWKRIEFILKVNQNSLPKFLNTPIKGEFIFACDRRLWQAGIFMAFIFNKFQKYDDPYPIRLERMIDWCQKNIPMNRFALELWSKKGMLGTEELNLLSNFDRYNAVREFVRHLEREGFIKFLYSNRYKIINDKLLLNSIHQTDSSLICTGVNNAWITSLTEDYQERFQERAAIHEYCGGLPRADAENLAYLSLFNPPSQLHA